MATCGNSKIGVTAGDNDVIGRYGNYDIYDGEFTQAIRDYTKVSSMCGGENANGYYFDGHSHVDLFICMRKSEAQLCSAGIFLNTRASYDEHFLRVGWSEALLCFVGLFLCMQGTGTFYFNAFISTMNQLWTATIIMATTFVFYLSTKASTTNEVGRNGVWARLVE